MVVVSDHGLAETSSKRVIFLEDLMDVSTVQVESTGPNGGVRPKSGSAPELAAAIEQVDDGAPQTETEPPLRLFNVSAFIKRET